MTQPAQSATRHTFCRLCEVMCGLEVTLRDGAVSRVRPDAGHPVSQGFACHKGLLALDVHRDPHRLDRPLRRSPRGWEAIGWPEATAGIAERLRAVIDRHGPEAVAVYIGNPAAFNPLAGPAAAVFLLSLGSDRIFSSATQDCANKFTVSEILYGSADVHPIPDLDRTDHLLLIGSNPRISKSSFLSVPDPVAALRAIPARGGRVTFVNPLRIEPGIGETLQIRPDTDAYLLAAMLHHIDRAIGFDLASYGEAVVHVERLRSWLSGFPPARVAPVVGVEAQAIERLATDFARAPTASVHASTGLNMGRQGALAYFLVQMLALVTGNLDRPGGNLVQTRALAPMPATAGPTPESFEATPWGPVRRSKGSLPAALLPKWIGAEREPVRALISLAGNPLLSLAGGEEVAAAFGELDLLVSVDLYRNATAELAHFALPATDWFERPDLNAFVQGVQRRPYVQLTDALVAPAGERKPESEIFALLSRAMGVGPGTPAGLEGLAASYDPQLAAHGLSVAELARRDRGVALLDGAGAGSLFGPEGRSADAPIDCAPELLGPAFERASRIFEEERQSRPTDALRLITRRTRNTLNSALANVATLPRGARCNPLWMHPDDASARGLAEGDPATVSNETGSLVAPVALDAKLRPGVVAMTHGFGFAHNPGMPRARAHPGVNVNRLAPAGPGSFDPLSGMSRLTGIPVAVGRAPAGAEAGTG